MENNLFSRLLRLKMYITAFPALYVQKKCQILLKAELYLDLFNLHN